MATMNPDRTRRVMYLRQRVVCLVAAGALGAAAAAPGGRPLVAGLFAVAALVLAALAAPRWRGRAPVSWIGTVSRFAFRARHEVGRIGVVPLITGSANAVPIEVSGVEVGAIEDAHGLAAIIEIGEPAALLVTGGVTVPMPADLAGSPASDEPATTAQVLVVRCGHFQRVFVAVRVGADGVAWTDMQLRQAMSGAVRGVVRRLARAGVSARALPVADALSAVEWSVAGDTLPANTAIDESWDHLQIGAAHHVTLRIGLEPRGSRPDEGVTPDTIDGLLETGAAVAALSIAEDRLLLRLSAPTPAALASAVAGTMKAGVGHVSRVDGEQRACLAATLPLGFVDPATAGSRHGGTLAWPTGTPALPTGPPAHSSGPLALPDAGLFVGRDRRGAPVLLQLNPNRTTPVRLAVVGGPMASRVLSDRLRALATAPGGAADVPVTMAVLEGLTPADSATLASADVVVCQPVSQPEAALVASALGLTRAGAWLSRIEGDMIAIISDGALRWAQLSAHAGHQGK